MVLCLKVLSEVLRTRGRCPWLTSNIGAQRLVTLYTATLLPRLDKHEHALCTMTSCRHSRHPVPSRSTHRHVYSGRCVVQYALETDLISVLDQGDFPVVAGRGVAEDGGLVVVGSRATQKGYVAISHVW